MRAGDEGQWVALNASAKLHLVACFSMFSPDSQLFPSAKCEIQRLRAPPFTHPWPLPPLLPTPLPSFFLPLPSTPTCPPTPPLLPSTHIFEPLSVGRPHVRVLGARARHHCVTHPCVHGRLYVRMVANLWRGGGRGCGWRCRVHERIWGT